MEALSVVVLESLSQLSLLPTTEPQGLSPTHSPLNISKLVCESDEGPIDLTKEIPIDYQGWYCDYMDDEEKESIIEDQDREPFSSPKVVVIPSQVSIAPNLIPVIGRADPIIHAPLHELTTFQIPITANSKMVHEFPECESSTKRAKLAKSIASLSQILSIPRFERNNSRKGSSALYCHNKLFTSAAFAAEVQEKLKRDATKELAIQERKKKQEDSSKKKQENENKKIDIMVKRWIKEMEKKVD